MENIKRVKKWVLILNLLIFFLVPNFEVLAATPSITLSGDTSVSPGSTITYSIVMDTNGEAVTKFTASVTFDSSVLTLSKIEEGSGWNGTTSGGSSPYSIEYGSQAESGITSASTTVATLYFKVKSSATSSSATISLGSIYATILDDEGATSTSGITGVSKTLKIKSSDNTLSDIKINGTSIENFASDTYDYDVTVESSVSSAKIVATTTSSKASLKSGYGNRTVSLSYGANAVQIIVTSESGIDQTYTISITREDTRSTDTTLSSITVDGEEIENFKSTTYSYTIKKYQMESVEIVGTPTDSNATVKVTAPSSIVIGENTYTLTVTSENGDTSNYTVIINNIDGTISKMLKTLSIKGYDIDFDKNNNRYEIMYNKSKFKNLHIYYTTVASSDEVTAVLSPDINNDTEALEALGVGDEITITITGIDGESAEYTIVIVKDSRVSFFLILEIFLIVVIVVVIIIIARKRKKKKNNPSKKDDKKTNSSKKENVEKKKETVTKEPTTRTRRSEKNNSDLAVPIVEGKPTKKRRFSIYEDEYEEVEVEVDDDEFAKTKELTDEELNIK